MLFRHFPGESSHQFDGFLVHMPDQRDSTVSQSGIRKDIGDDITCEEMTAGADQYDFCHDNTPVFVSDIDDSG
jgi:hypothetical protein